MNSNIETGNNKMLRNTKNNNDQNIKQRAYNLFNAILYSVVVGIYKKNIQENEKKINSLSF